MVDIVHFKFFYLFLIFPSSEICRLEFFFGIYFGTQSSVEDHTYIDYISITTHYLITIRKRFAVLRETFLPEGVRSNGGRFENHANTLEYIHTLLSAQNESWEQRHENT